LGGGIYIKAATDGVVYFMGSLSENTEHESETRSGGGIGENAGMQLQVQLIRAAGYRLRRDVG
jgi:hypothetical protein